MLTHGLFWLLGSFWVTGSTEEALNGGQTASGPAVSPLEDLAGHSPCIPISITSLDEFTHLEVSWDVSTLQRLSTVGSLRQDSERCREGMSVLGTSSPCSSHYCDIIPDKGDLGKGLPMV